MPVIATAAGTGEQTYATRLAQAQKLAEKGDEVGASKAYEALIKAFPAQPQAYNNLAAIKARHGQYRQAQVLLEQALRSNPVYATVYENLSAIYVEMARDSYGKALKLETPQKPLALKELNKPLAIAKAPQQIASAEKADNPVKMPAPVPDVARPPDDALAQKQTTATPTVADKPPVQANIEAQKPPVVSETSATEGMEKPTQQPVTVIAQQNDAVESGEQAATEPPLLPFNKEDVITRLQGWAAAWSEKAVDRYLSFYANDYAPAGMTHTQWVTQRRQRILAPKSILVSLGDFSVEATKDDEALVRLIQEYQSPRYRDKTRKEFRLLHTHDGWRIVEEKTIAKLH